jgi:hypothetical protein
MTRREAVLEATGEPFVDVVTRRANETESDSPSAASTDRDRDPNTGARDDDRE